jgi:hypothetical protein
LSEYIHAKFYCRLRVHEHVYKNTRNATILLITTHNVNIDTQILKTLQNTRTRSEYIHVRLYCWLHIDESVYTNTPNISLYIANYIKNTQILKIAIKVFIRVCMSIYLKKHESDIRDKRKNIISKF